MSGSMNKCGEGSEASDLGEAMAGFEDSKACVAEGDGRGTGISRGVYASQEAGRERTK